MLEENNIIPTNVFMCCLDDKEIIKRNELANKQHLAKLCI